MLLCVALGIVLTGLPAWVVLIGIAGAFAAVGSALGAIPATLLMALPGRIVGLLEHDLLQALPLYVLLGVLLNRLPLADVLYRVGVACLGRRAAAPRIAGLGLGMVLAPMNGSIGASVSMLHRTVLPRLEAAGVPEVRATALVAAASTLGIVVPPSLVLILLGDAMMRAHTEAVNATHAAVRILNTQDVFRAALPAAGLFLLLAIVIAAWPARGEPRVAVTPATTMRERVVAALALLLIVALLVSVALGYLYAVEGAATGGAVLVLYGALSGTLTRIVFAQVLRETLALTGALFALLLAANVFTLVMRMYGTDRWVAALLGDPALPATTVLAAVLGVLAVSSLVLDAFEILFVIVPIVAPPLLMKVPDAAWVSVLFLLILQAGFLVPPLGYALMMLQTLRGRPVPQAALARAVMPWLLAQGVVLAAVLGWPALTTVLRAPLEAAPAADMQDGAAAILQQTAPQADPEVPDIPPPDDSPPIIPPPDGAGPAR
ncbi:TRAP transporter large permease subunit [Niveibacterium umoris]